MAEIASILNSVKKDIGVGLDYDHFDPEIITAINTAFSSLNQIGAGPDAGFSISDETTEWSDYISDPDSPTLGFVKSFVSKKAKMLFDPPTSSALMEAMKENLKELEFRINVSVDPNQNEEESS